MPTIEKFWTKEILKIIPDAILPLEEGLYKSLQGNSTDNPPFYELMQKLYDKHSDGKI